MTIDLDEWERLAKAAKPGPDVWSAFDTHEKFIRYTSPWRVLAAIAEIRALRAEVDRLRDAARLAISTIEGLEGVEIPYASAMELSHSRSALLAAIDAGRARAQEEKP